MPIIALLITTFLSSAIYYFFWMGGADRVLDSMSAHRRAKRRQAALAKERIAPVMAVDDPREAALALMLLIAREATAPTREQYAAVDDKARSVFGFGHDFENRMTHVRFVAGRADSFAQAAAVFSSLFVRRLTEVEKRELIGMIEQSAAIEGPSEEQIASIDVLKRRLWP